MVKWMAVIRAELSQANNDEEERLLLIKTIPWETP